MEKSDAPRRSPTTLAPVNVRSRKIRKGTSGAFDRSSITMKAPPAPEQVRDPPAEQQESAERDHVGVQDPGEIGLREVLSASDRRQRDVHDRSVEHDHELGDADQAQRLPPLPLEGTLSRFRREVRLRSHGAEPSRLSASVAIRTRTRTCP